MVPDCIFVTFTYLAILVNILPPSDDRVHLEETHFESDNTMGSSMKYYHLGKVRQDFSQLSEEMEQNTS